MIKLDYILISIFSFKLTPFYIIDIIIFIEKTWIIYVEDKPLYLKYPNFFEKSMIISLAFYLKFKFFTV